MSKWYTYKDEMVNLDRVNYITKDYTSEPPDYEYPSIIFAYTKTNKGDWYGDNFIEIVYREEEEVYGEERDKAFEEIKKILMETSSETKPPSHCY